MTQLFTKTSGEAGIHSLIVLLHILFYTNCLYWSRFIEKLLAGDTNAAHHSLLLRSFSVQFSVQGHCGPIFFFYRCAHYSNHSNFPT